MTPDANGRPTEATSAGPGGGAAAESQARACPDPACGQTLREGAAFCSRCGQAVDRQPPIPAEAGRASCANPACRQPLREGHAFCTHCGTRGAAAMGEPSAAAPSAAAPAAGAGPVPCWRRALGLSLAALGLVLILGAAAWGLRVLGKLPFGGGARPSPQTLADDETDIWAEMDEIRAGADAELDRKLDESAERPTEATAWPDEETAETHVSGAEGTGP